MMEETIELSDLLSIVVKRKWLIALSVITAMAIGGFYSFFMITPMYKADTTLMVNSSKGLDTSDIAASFDLGSITLSQKLVITYGEIVKSRIVLNQVIDQLEMDESYTQLLAKITSAPVGTTEILKISVEDPDPERAAVIANKISSVFIKEVMRILKVNNVEIIDKAIGLDTPINFKPVLNMALSFILGLMAGLFISFTLEYLDNTIKTSEDVEKHLGLATIGAIPDFGQVKKNKR